MRIVVDIGAPEFEALLKSLLMFGWPKYEEEEDNGEAEE